MLLFLLWPKGLLKRAMCGGIDESAMGRRVHRGQSVLPVITLVIVAAAISRCRGFGGRLC